MFRSLRQLASWKTAKFLAVLLVVVLAVFTAYFWRLGNLTDGLSPAEKVAVSSSQALQSIADNPLNAPHRLGQYLAILLNDSTRWAVRLPSAVFMTLFLGLFYLMLRLWFGRLVGLLGALLLASTPWTIVLARNAVPDVLFLAPIGLICAFLWLTRRTNLRSLIWIVLCAAVAISLYVPGVIWFVALAAAFKHRTVLAIAKNIRWWAVWLGVIFAAVLLAPLIWAIVVQPGIMRELLLIPWPIDQPLEIVKSVAWAGLSLVWRLPQPTDFTVGRLPLLTLAQLALAGVGAYAMWAKARKVVYWLAAVLLGYVIAAGLNDRLTLLLPSVMVVCVLAAAGLRYLYVEWNSIFPRNPLPRGLAVVLMVLVIGVSMAYGLRYSLVAWPNAPATKSIYVIK